MPAMKLKSLLFTFALFCLLSFKADSEVYVCGKSKIYHDSLDHHALKNTCKSQIYKMSESEAISSGRRKCRCRF